MKMTENEYGDLDLDLGYEDEVPSDVAPPADEPPAKVVQKEQFAPKQEQISLPKEEWEQVQGTLGQIQRERFFNETITSLKQEFPKFDKDKVITRLKEIHAKDPQKAEMFNTPVGFRALWLEIAQNEVLNDPVNGGGSKGGGSDFQTYLNDAMQNKQGALKKAINLAL